MIWAQLWDELWDVLHMLCGEVLEYPSEAGRSGLGRWPGWGGSQQPEPRES